MRCFTLMILTAALMSAPAAAYADTMVFVTSLFGSNENPPIASPGTGFVVVLLNPTAHTIQINATFSNLTSPTTAAHIHCCTPSPFSPANAGVATSLPAFPGFLLGGTSGTYISPVFDLTQPLIYNPAFVTAQGGLLQAEAALVAGIQNAQTYFNIHTQANGGGEIRGILAPVPEPSSVILLGSGLLGFVLFRRRRAA